MNTPARPWTGAAASQVNADLSLPGYPDVFVVGDMAHVEQGDQPLPGLAPVARSRGQARRRPDCAPHQGRGNPSLSLAADRGVMATMGPRRGGGGHPRPAPQRLCRLAAVALYPPDVLGRLSQPHLRLFAVGVELSHLWAQRSPDSGSRQAGATGCGALRLAASPGAHVAKWRPGSGPPQAPTRQSPRPAARESRRCRVARRRVRPRASPAHGRQAHAAVRAIDHLR